ncbi:low temperature requirement protein A [Patulibacter americanus]|uniref:low temperature requirement protein A n=1 Tax=Patulibacter americanus TaxID=588672 RepID=UPI00040C4D72|nr:low temperature requirement protein A [Patulibacter americanus]
MSAPEALRAQRPGAAGRSRHLRDRSGGHGSATTVELFFDLVYVFAITQLAHLLIGHLDAEGAARTLFLLVVVWWAWNYTTWMVNWFDPGSLPVRLVLIGGMLASLVMATAIPVAFTTGGIVFAAGYVALQCGRNLVGMLLLPRGEPLRGTFERLLAWSVASGVLWIAGGLADESVRPLLWIAALAIDLAGPFARYRTPGLGRSETSDWTIDGTLFAERFHLFIIIALGESIVITGATSADAGLGVETIAALAVAFTGTAALWWLYFETVAGSSQRDIAQHEDPGRIARDAYTYLHVPIVAGIILVAVGDELLLLHPLDELDGAGIAVTLGGPALYLLGELLVRLRMVGRVSVRRSVAIAALAVLVVPALVLPAIAVAGLATAVLVALAAWEYEGRPAG